jgi:riboflavin biosynthesis pyrimidine reductase
VIAPFELLFSELPAGNHLPAELQRIYGGDLPATTAGAGRPAISTNFVVSHDGRISFDLPGRRGGNAISGRSRHDHWLMELLRARADAVLLGAETLRAAPRHRWQAGELIDSPYFADLRRAAGRPELPDLVILSRSGDLPSAAAALQLQRRIIVLTGRDGAARLRNQERSRIVLDGLDQADGLAGLLQQLHSGLGIRALLSEGGGRTYGSLLAAQALDEIFLTRSPLIVGNPAAPAAARPGLVEGVAFTPDNAPRLRLLSLRRADDLLFEHLRILPLQQLM